MFEEQPEQHSHFDPGVACRLEQQLLQIQTNNAEEVPRKT